MWPPAKSLEGGLEEKLGVLDKMEGGLAVVLTGLLGREGPGVAEGVRWDESSASESRSEAKEGGEVMAVRLSAEWLGRRGVNTIP